MRSEKVFLFRFVKRNGYNLFLVADCFSINLWSVEDKYTSELRRKFDEMWFGWKIRSIRFIRAQKITSVCRIPISMSLEKIICVHPRNLREINTMNNPRVKNIILFFICHSVILLCNALIINKITCWQICKYLQYLSFIYHKT